MPATPLLTTLLVLMAALALPSAAQAELATAPVTRGDGRPSYSAEGVVEAVRHAEVAAQVPGRITQVPVKAGDRVAAGALLASIDARAANDQQAAARAQLDAAQRDYERSRELYAKNYISKAAMDRVDAQYKTLRAQSNIAGTQSGFHRVLAPYAGIVAEVFVEVGDMAQPGKALFSFYDPSQLRVTVQVPESIAAAIAASQSASIDIPNAAPAQRLQTVQQITVLPTSSSAAHTRELRLNLAANVDVSPGAFARVLLPLSGDQSARLSVPVSSVLTRSEFHGVYVVDSRGLVQLRQVRLGRQSGDRIEVLAGLRENERVALDPLAALRQSTAPLRGAAHE